MKHWEKCMEIVSLLLKVMYAITYENSHSTYFKHKEMQFSNQFVFHGVSNAFIKNIKNSTFSR